MTFGCLKLTYIMCLDALHMLFIQFVSAKCLLSTVPVKVLLKLWYRDEQTSTEKSCFYTEVTMFLQWFFIFFLFFEHLWAQGRNQFMIQSYSLTVLSPSAKWISLMNFCSESQSAQYIKPWGGWATIAEEHQVPLQTRTRSYHGLRFTETGQLKT